MKDWIELGKNTGGGDGAARAKRLRAIPVPKSYREQQLDQIFKDFRLDERRRKDA